ncbi:hypothetical protein BT93_A1649 [Corymbia citriodora subsp. variegata]|nr:hypothetical protein BT93_A1649 [Corymbia citriodora subsp. variegata]
MSSPNDRNLLLFWAIGMMLVSVSAGDAPSFYIFGDSTVDVGTNNYIPSRAKADFPYNGIDFSYSKWTGRFSNGYNSADEIVRQLGGKESPPPFLALLRNPSSFQSNLLQGVNFTSGGAGILDATGNLTWGHVITMTQQVQQFATVQSNVTQLLGNNSANFFANSLFLISVGSNDIFDHYYYDEANVTQLQLMANLQSSFSDQLTDLYNLGARKFGIVSVPPVGCCPRARLLNLNESRQSGCLTELNDYAQAFYSMVSELLQDLSSKLRGMIYSLGDGYQMTYLLIQDPQVFRIEVIDKACCGNGTLNAEKPCDNVNYSVNLCPNRREYLFWDFFHPTEYVAYLAAVTLVNGNSFVAPMNFSQLARAVT